jgi:hypothetical protein
MRALIVTKDLLPALLTLDDPTLGSLMRSAVCLVAHERDEAPDGADANSALMFAWTCLREKILLHGIKYEEECERRRDHARKAALTRHGVEQVIPGSVPEQTRARPRNAPANH